MMRLRNATEYDVEKMLKLKSQLMLPPTASSMSRGGFLLGSSQEQYLFFIQHAVVLVLEDSRLNDAIAGFAIGLPNETLRRTDVWKRRESIQWKDLSAQKIEEFRLCYVEQLAILPRVIYKLYAPALAFAIAKKLFDQHDFLLTTVVHKPVQNLASLALLERIGARLIGFVEEDYHQVGRITSAIYCTERSTYRARMENPSGHQRLVSRLLRTIENLTREEV
ncbi:MAG: hypothetical protein F6K28_23670 [Microcoleus sp. SIO2G3]|nr:hypothetical protein [Microcoleus sp. SIO2G3]